jgi:A/G-specific adenine glycosylase
VNSKGNGISLTPSTLLLENAAARTSFRKSLVRWFDASARDLPWRRTRDPYAIWLSEIMLQQTQAATVVAYFERFLKQFPTIDRLAGATEQEVLKLWEGLGYYRRARQLHAAAQEIATNHQGRFPRQFETIRSLPGIGRYTAGAIASFAFDDRRPIVEANTLRLYCRLLGLRSDPRTKATQEALWTFAERILPARQPGRLNQALIELGSQVCKPRLPLCDACPVNEFCAARQLGLVDTIPVKSPKTRYEAALEAAVVVRNRRDEILLRQRGDKERWAGMWDFPRGVLALGEEANKVSSTQKSKIRELVESQTGAKIQLGAERFRLRHSVTRFRIELVCFDAVLRGRLAARRDLRWVAASELAGIALSVSARKLATNIAKSSGNGRRLQRPN